MSGQQVDEAVLTGTDSSPLHWEVSTDPAPGQITVAVEVVQLFRALDYYRYATGVSVEQLPEYTGVAEDGVPGIVDDIWLASHLDPTEDPGAGPVWIWVQDAVEEHPGVVRVVLCEDVGWWEQETRQSLLPRQSRSPIINVFRVRRSHEVGGAEWRVFSGGPIFADDDIVDPCREWATHELADAE